MQPLAAAGYRTLAPDLRGFGHTKLLSQTAGATPKASDYTHKEVCSDLDAFLSALNIPSAVFIGHDWGGAIVWVCVIHSLHSPLNHPSTDCVLLIVCCSDFTLR